MADRTIHRALISAFDKTGLVDFARALHDEFGIEIISTGGTARTLGDQGIAVTTVESLAGFPEMLGGRVKTLHPRIHAAVLADRDDPQHLAQLAKAKIQPIDMVVIDLYPFERTVADPDCTMGDAIEMIDIGGPCLLRAAAKNHRHVLPVVGSAHYPRVLDALRTGGGKVPDALRVELAEEAFRTTSRYDNRVSAYLARQISTGVGGRVGTAGAIQLPPGSDVELRYGENPHQAARFHPLPHRAPGSPRPVSGEAHAEPEMSFNNHVDADAALQVCRELARAFCGSTDDSKENRSASHHRHACVFVKHTNPCGCALADRLVEAYRQAYLGDPQAAMGGILATTFAIGTDEAEFVLASLDRWGRDAGAGSFFVEVWLAPRFDDAAVKHIRDARSWGRRVRLRAVGDMTAAPDLDDTEIRKIAGGVLVQDRDRVGLNLDEWRVVTRRQPDDREWADLRLAWLICKHTKSNAVTICRDGMLLGNGAGQMSRIMSCRIATCLAKDNGHGDRLSGAVAASDAFFPFRDGPDVLMDAGVGAIIQPGGSKRDAETIAACDERNVAMVLTGTRHFRH